MASDTKINDFGRIDTKQGAAYYASRMCVDNGFHHTVYLLQGTGTRYGGSRQPGHLKRITAFYGFLFGHADMRQRRICKNDIWNRNPVIGLSLFIAEQPVGDNAEIIQR